jgi:hypothetical protein
MTGQAHPSSPTNMRSVPAENSRSARLDQRRTIQLPMSSLKEREQPRCLGERCFATFSSGCSTPFWTSGCSPCWPSLLASIPLSPTSFRLRSARVICSTGYSFCDRTQRPTSGGPVVAVTLISGLVVQSAVIWTGDAPRRAPRARPTSYVLTSGGSRPRRGRSPSHVSERCSRRRQGGRPPR